MLADRVLSKEPKDFGLAVVSVSAALAMVRMPQGFNLHSRNAEVRANCSSYFFRCIDLASNLDAKLVYVSSAASKVISELEIEKALFCASLVSCAEHAESAGVRIVLGHNPAGIVRTLEAISEFVVNVGMQNLGAVIDTNHYLISGESPVESDGKAGTHLFHLQTDNNDGLHDLY